MSSSRDPVDVLAERPQAVAVGHDEDGAAPGALGQQVGDDGVEPVGEDSVHHVGQALGRGRASAGTSR